MDSELDIIIRAISDVKSADDATKELVNRVFTKLKDGAIKLPINSKLDKSELKKLDDNVKQARKEVVDRYNKLQKEMANPKGFDAFSEKAIDELVELGKAYAKFNSKASGQSKNSTAAVSDVKAALGEVFQLYENEVKLLNSKIKELNLQDKVSKTLNTTRKVRGPRNFGPHSKEEINANIEQNNKRKYKGLHSIAPREASTTIEAGKTNKHLMKLSEYSSHGSNWATELSRILKIEIEKAAENLTSWIEPNYKVGGKDNKIGLGNITPETTEKQFLGDTIKVVKNQLTKAIRDLESGSEEITLDTLKEYAAVIKVLTKAIGKTTEDAEKTITSSIEKVYNSNTEVKTKRGTKSTLTKIGGVDRDEGEEKGVGVGHDNTQKLVKELYKSMHQWDSEVVADTISKEMISGTDKTIKAVNKNNKKQSSGTSADKQVSEVKLSSDYKAEMAKLATATDEVFAEVRNGTKATETQTISDKVENVRENVADSKEEKVVSTTRDINRDIARATKTDAATGFNTDEKADALIDVVKNILRELTIISKSTKKAEENVNKSTETEKSTKTANKNKKKVEKRTGLNKLAVDEEFTKDVVWDKKEQDTKQTETESKIPDVIELPSDIKSTYKALTDATRLALNKPDGRRRKISKGLIDETPWRKSLPNTQKSMTKALDVLRDLEGKPLANRKTTKESTSASINDFKIYNNELENKRFKVKLNEQETKLRDLAAKKNAEKATKKSGSGEKPPFIPKVIIPEEPLYSNKVQKSSISASAKNQTIWDKFSDAMLKATGAIDKYRSALDATAEEQDQMAAERITTHGLNNGRNPNDTGDIASIKRALELFRTNKRSIEDNPELAQKIQLTEGIEVDTTEITDAFSKALSGRQMRNAQMGGSIPRQIVGAMTGFVGMPSLEKSRAQADGLNQVLGNINKAMQSVLSSIQMKETELSGMEKTGEVKFNKDGYIEEGSSAAYKTLADLEEYKLVLKTILADMQMVDQVVETTGGKFSKMSKLLSFSSPVLRENNDILRNITSGLDKNGKALKYQTRMAEILNYTFQLMSRSIGQMLKNWLVQLNPITQIKKAFQQFMGWNTKWQRTMNVITYNLHAILEPFMDKIAQFLVTNIGFICINDIRKRRFCQLFEEKSRGRQGTAPQGIGLACEISFGCEIMPFRHCEIFCLRRK
jgi:hypothetical protein